MKLDINLLIDTLISGTINYLEKNEIQLSYEQQSSLRNALSNELDQEFELQRMTPTQIVNTYINGELLINLNLTPNDFGDEAREQIIIWGLFKAKKFDEE